MMKLCKNRKLTRVPASSVFEAPILTLVKEEINRLNQKEAVKADYFCWMMFSSKRYDVTGDMLEGDNYSNSRITIIIIFIF